MKLIDAFLDDIDLRDERFRISYHFDLEKLLLSIKRIGLVSPLVVVERKHSKYVLVSGWKRIYACRQLSLTCIPVFVLDEKEDSRVFLFSLYENLAIRTFNLLEKAEIVYKLNGHIDDEKKIVRQFFPILGIPATLAYFDIFCDIARFDPAWKKIIFEKKIPLSSLQLLVEYSPEERERLLPLILPMNLNKLRQFLEDLFDLSKKTGDSPHSILSAPKIQSMLHNDKLSALQRADKIRSLLRTKRYPTISSWKKSFDAAIKKAELSKDVTFDSNSFFEDGEFGVTFSFRDKKAFQKRLAKLQDLLADEDLFSLFNLDLS
jgi:hypothetical protein